MNFLLLRVVTLVAINVVVISGAFIEELPDSNSAADDDDDNNDLQVALRPKNGMQMIPFSPTTTDTLQQPLGSVKPPQYLGYRVPKYLEYPQPKLLEYPQPMLPKNNVISSQEEAEGCGQWKDTDETDPPPWTVFVIKTAADMGNSMMTTPKKGTTVVAAMISVYHALMRNDKNSIFIKPENKDDYEVYLAPSQQTMVNPKTKSWKIDAVHLAGALPIGMDAATSKVLTAETFAVLTLNEMITTGTVCLPPISFIDMYTEIKQKYLNVPLITTMTFQKNNQYIHVANMNGTIDDVIIRRNRYDETPTQTITVALQQEDMQDLMYKRNWMVGFEPVSYRNGSGRFHLAGFTKNAGILNAATNKGVVHIDNYYLWNIVAWLDELMKCPSSEPEVDLAVSGDCGNWDDESDVPQPWMVAIVEKTPSAFQYNLEYIMFALRISQNYVLAYNSPAYITADNKDNLRVYYPQKTNEMFTERTPFSEIATITPFSTTAFVLLELRKKKNGVAIPAFKPVCLPEMNDFQVPICHNLFIPTYSPQKLRNGLSLRTGHTQVVVHSNDAEDDYLGVQYEAIFYPSAKQGPITLKNKMGRHVLVGFLVDWKDYDGSTYACGMDIAQGDFTAALAWIKQKAMAN